MISPPPPLILSLIGLPLIAASVVAVFLTMESNAAVAQFAAVLPLAYLLGSIPWGYLLLHWRRGMDIREYGSGRTGVSNVLRTGGGKVAVLVLSLLLKYPSSFGI